MTNPPSSSIGKQNNNNITLSTKNNPTENINNITSKYSPDMLTMKSEETKKEIIIETENKVTMAKEEISVETPLNATKKEEKDILNPSKEKSNQLNDAAPATTDNALDRKGASSETTTKTTKSSGEGNLSPETFEKTFTTEAPKVEKESASQKEEAPAATTANSSEDGSHNKVLPAQNNHNKEGKTNAKVESESAAEQMQTAIPTPPRTEPAAGVSDNTEKVEKSEALIKEQLKYCGTILRGLKRHPQASPFLLPVDHVALNIPTYPEIVKNPMDISTVSKKYEDHLYKTADEFVADVHLIFQACYLFNQPDHQVHKMGQSLEKYFKSACTKIPKTLEAERSKISKASSFGTPSPGSGRGKREVSAPSRLSGSAFASGTPRNRGRGNPEMTFCSGVLRELFKKTHQAIMWPFLEPVDPVKLGIPDYFDIIKEPMDLSTVKSKLEAGVYQSAEEFEYDVRLIIGNCYKYNAPDHEVVALCKSFESIFNSKWSRKPSSFQQTHSYSQSQHSSLEDLDSDSEKILEINRKIQVLQQELNSLLMKRRNRSGSSSSAAAASSTARPKKISKTSKSASSSKAPAAISEEDFLSRPMSFEEKRQLSIEVNNLAPEKLGRVVEIIQAGMALETKGDSDVIELDIESLNVRTLRQLQKYVMECKGITSFEAMLGLPEKQKPKKKKRSTDNNANSNNISAAAAAAAAMSSDDDSSDADLD